MGGTGASPFCFSRQLEFSPQLCMNRSGWSVYNVNKEEGVSGLVQGPMFMKEFGRIKKKWRMGMENNMMVVMIREERRM